MSFSDTRKCKKAADNGKAFNALLMDLSKAFDCFDHELLITKLIAYGFSLSALKPIHDFLLNWKQWTKINSSYSSWHDIIFGAPQGSVLGPILFPIYTNVVSANNMDGGFKYSEGATTKLLKWFSDNLMKSKLLGVKFDHKLTFNSHISDLCKKASKKVYALARVRPYINISKRTETFSFLPIICVRQAEICLRQL